MSSVPGERPRWGSGVTEPSGVRRKQTTVVAVDEPQRAVDRRGDGLWGRVRGDALLYEINAPVGANSAEPRKNPSVNQSAPSAARTRPSGDASAQRAVTSAASTSA